MFHQKPYKFMSNTGTYRFSKELGRVVKVSDSIPIIRQIAGWKREMNPTSEVAMCNSNTGDRKLKEIYSRA